MPAETAPSNSDEKCMTGQESSRALLLSLHRVMIRLNGDRVKTFQSLKLRTTYGVRKWKIDMMRQATNTS